MELVLLPPRCLCRRLPRGPIQAPRHGDQVRGSAWLGSARDREEPPHSWRGRQYSVSQRMIPTMSAPTIAPDHDVERDRDTSGSCIRCPLCGWSPGKGDKWFCTCGHEWNTFDTGGVCPACLHQWSETQCLSCSRWSAHSLWYAP